MCHVSEFIAKLSPITNHLEVILVGGFNHIEKYEFVSWDDDIPDIYIYGNIKFMFQTTNQYTMSY